MRALLVASRRIEAGKARGGAVGAWQRLSGLAGVGTAFARLYFHRTQTNQLPATVRMQPAW